MVYGFAERPRVGAWRFRRSWAARTALSSSRREAQAGLSVVIEVKDVENESDLHKGEDMKIKCAVQDASSVLFRDGRPEGLRRIRAVWAD